MQAEVLKLEYDHYKDTAGILRTRESQRDRLMAYVLVAHFSLALFILYVSSATRLLSSLSIGFLKGDLTALPVPAILSGLWLVTYSLLLRYAQVTVTIERQYKYLHDLEELLTLVTNAKFDREGRSYAANYPIFSRWVQISYRYIIPLVLATALVVLLAVEWSGFPGGWPYRVLDTVLAGSSVISVVLLRLGKLGRSKR